MPAKVTQGCSPLPTHQEMWTGRPTIPTVVGDLMSLGSGTVPPDPLKQERHKEVRLTGYFITPKATSHRPCRLLGLSGMRTGGSVTTQDREIYGDKVPRPRYPQGLGCCLSPQDQTTNLHFHHPFAQGGTP